MVRTLSLVAVVSLLSACASSLTSVPVKGDDSARARLAGEWKGEFEGIGNARRGTIDFNLQMGRHTADAKVVMDIGGEPMQLKVAYLQVDDARLVGEIEPYRDPMCDCTVQTEFEGAMSAGFIVGTYQVRPEKGDKMIGNWTAERIAE